MSRCKKGCFGPEAAFFRGRLSFDQVLRVCRRLILLAIERADPAADPPCAPTCRCSA
ncbi:hypothetical protein THIOKS190105 [Thiocapsa sp. KS1]|nr:hypothetical protein THIOKS190105 [Thiocapsa sp. KS1]